MAYPYMGEVRHSNMVLSTPAMKHFLGADRYAVIGRTLNDRTRFDNRTLRWYIEHGLPVTPIKPNAMPREVIEGMYVLSDPTLLPDLSSTSISIILHPDLGFPILQALFPDTPTPTGREPRAIWFQPGADDKRIWDWVRARGIEDRAVVRGGCLLRDGQEALKMVRRDRDSASASVTPMPVPSGLITQRPSISTESQNWSQLVTPEMISGPHINTPGFTPSPLQPQPSTPSQKVGAGVGMTQGMAGMAGMTWTPGMDAPMVLMTGSGSGVNIGAGTSAGGYTQQQYYQTPQPQSQPLPQSQPQPQSQSQSQSHVFAQPSQPYSLQQQGYAKQNRTPQLHVYAQPSQQPQQLQQLQQPQIQSSPYNQQYQIQQHGGDHWGGQQSGQVYTQSPVQQGKQGVAMTDLQRLQNAQWEWSAYGGSQAGLETLPPRRK